MSNRNRSVEQALTEMEFDISSLTPKWKNRLLISPNPCGKIGDDLLEDTYTNIPDIKTFYHLMYMGNFL